MAFRVRPVDPAFLSGDGIERPDSFLQTPFWAQFKASHGWKPFYFILEDGTLPARSLVVLSRYLGRWGSFAYVPMGPPDGFVAVNGWETKLTELAELISGHLPDSTVFIRFDPPSLGLQLKAQNLNVVRGRPVKAFSDVQPPDTVILNLDRDPEELMEGMKPKWRYNIRLGEKKGVNIRTLIGHKAAESGIDAFYLLYQETASRDGISIHSKSYYRDLFIASAEYMPRADLRLYIASHDSLDIAAIIVLFDESGATYLYGASSNEKRNLMPAYALQWRAIQDARQAGCTTYDFYGIPPTEDPKHPMHGLYRFKTGFGGIVIHRIGSVDIPLAPMRYFLWRIAERARSGWHKRLKKILMKAIRQR